MREQLIARARAELRRVTARPEWRMGRTLATFAIRLLAANLVAVRRRTADVPMEWPEPRPTSRASIRPASRAELETNLVHDRGCLPGQSSHLACRAARELGASWPDELDIVELLEETELQDDRPSCVRRAALETLAGLDSKRARQAHARMRAIAERRAEWDEPSTAISRFVDVAPG